MSACQPACLSLCLSACVCAIVHTCMFNLLMDFHRKLPFPLETVYSLLNYVAKESFLVYLFDFKNEY